MLGFAVLTAVGAVNSTYEKAVVEEVTRTYDKKRSGSKRKYYADVEVSFDYNGEKATASTTVSKGSQSDLPGVGDTIDVQITKDGRVIASSPVKNVLMSVVGVLVGALLIWYSVSSMIEAKKKKEESSFSQDGV